MGAEKKRIISVSLPALDSPRKKFGTWASICMYIWVACVDLKLYRIWRRLDKSLELDEAGISGVSFPPDFSERKSTARVIGR